MKVDLYLKLGSKLKYQSISLYFTVIFYHGFELKMCASLLILWAENVNLIFLLF